MKRTLIVATTTAALLVGGAAPAMADPADRATKELLQENEQYRENERVPAYQLIPDCCEVGESYGFADIILGITFTLGLVLLW